MKNQSRNTEKLTVLPTRKQSHNKINSLRSVYKKELYKIKKSEISGTGVEDVYKPTLWYFHLFDFLVEQDVPRMPKETLIDDEEVYSVLEVS